MTVDTSIHLPKLTSRNKGFVIASQLLHSDVLWGDATAAERTDGIDLDDMWDFGAVLWANAADIADDKGNLDHVWTHVAEWLYDTDRLDADCDGDEDSHRDGIIAAIASRIEPYWNGSEWTADGLEYVAENAPRCLHCPEA